MIVSFQIEIIEGHDPSSYFWFRPVQILRPDQITWDEVRELPDEFSIEEGDVACFLSYFFHKYFDRDLLYNKNRYESGEFIDRGFEWYLTHNFYTYETARQMCEEIVRTADLLDKDYDDPALDEVKKEFSIYYLCSEDSEDWITGNQGAIRNYVGVITDFYRRFADRLRKMMDENPETDLISIMGP